jgi:hypothetical protein
MAPPPKIPYLEVAAIVTGWPASRGYVNAIAERFGVPVSTARSWVRHTRNRGYLPSGVDGHPCPACQGTGVKRWGPTRRTGE